MKKNIRCVDVRGVRYLRIDDVVALLRELGATEETDVRRRLDTAANNLVTVAEETTHAQAR